MYDGCHSPHGISFMCGRYMVSADLHTYDYLIGLASYHGAESGDGFGKCEGCAAV